MSNHKSSDELALEARALHLAAEKASKAAKDAAREEREAQRRKQREEDNLKLADERAEYDFASTYSSDWIGFDTGYNGGGEFTIYDWTTQQSSVSVSREDMVNLRNFLNEYLGD